MHRHESHDVIVVGAHAAGAATALLLAHAGVSTLVVDDGDPGSHPPSTNALTRGGVAQLARWDLLAAIIAAGTPPLRRTTLRYGDETVVISLKPSHGVDSAVRAPPVRTRSAAAAKPRWTPAPRWTCTARWRMCSSATVECPASGS